MEDSRNDVKFSIMEKCSVLLVVNAVHVRLCCYKQCGQCSKLSGGVHILPLCTFYVVQTLHCHFTVRSSDCVHIMIEMIGKLEYQPE